MNVPSGFNYLQLDSQRSLFAARQTCCVLRWAISRLPAHAENSEPKCDLFNGNVTLSLLQCARAHTYGSGTRVCTIIRRVCALANKIGVMSPK